MVNDALSFVVCLTHKGWYKTTTFSSVFKFSNAGSLVTVERKMLFHLLKEYAQDYVVLPKFTQMTAIMFLRF